MQQQSSWTELLIPIASAYDQCMQSPTPDCDEPDLDNDGLPDSTDPCPNDPTNNCNEDEGIIAIFIDTLELIKELFKSFWKGAVNGTLEYVIEILTTKSHEVTCVILTEFPGCEPTPEKVDEEPR